MVRALRKRKDWIVVAVIALVLLAGCYMKATVGRATPSPDGALSLGVVVVTQPGVAYGDRGEKSVDVTISSSDSNSSKTLLVKRVAITATRLDWTVDWLNSNEVRVTFFESVSEENMYSREKKTPTKPLSVLTFARASGESAFREVN